MLCSRYQLTVYKTYFCTHFSYQHYQQKQMASKAYSLLFISLISTCKSIFHLLIVNLHTNSFKLIWFIDVLILGMRSVSIPKAKAAFVK